jgi:hypothetical protein
MRKRRLLVLFVQNKISWKNDKNDAPKYCLSKLSLGSGSDNYWNRKLR